MLDPKLIADAFKFDYQPIFNALLAILFPIAVAGFVAAIVRGVKPLTAIAQVGLTLAVLVSFPFVCELAQTWVHYLVHDVLKASPSDTLQNYVDAVYKRQGSDPSGEWLIVKVFNVSANLTQAIVTAFFVVVSLVAAVFMVLGYGLQSFVLSSCLALSPLFFGLLLIPPVRSVAIHFFLSVAGVILWPLGWGVASIFTNALIKIMTDPTVNFSALPGGGPFYFLNNLMGGFIVGCWVILSTILAPIAIHRAFTSGVVSVSGGAQSLRSFLPR